MIRPAGLFFYIHTEYVIMDVVLLIIPTVISCIASFIPIGILHFISNHTVDEDIKELCYFAMKFVFGLCLLFSYVITAMIVISDKEFAI